jgi:hypothetical protein
MSVLGMGCRPPPPTAVWLSSTAFCRHTFMTVDYATCSTCHMLNMPLASIVDCWWVMFGMWVMHYDIQQFSEDKYLPCVLPCCCDTYSTRTHAHIVYNGFERRSMFDVICRLWVTPQ